MYKLDVTIELLNSQNSGYELANGLDYAINSNECLLDMKFANIKSGMIQLSKNSLQDIYDGKLQNTFSQALKVLRESVRLKKTFGEYFVLPPEVNKFLTLYYITNQPYELEISIKDVNNETQIKASIQHPELYQNQKLIKELGENIFKYEENMLLIEFDKRKSIHKKSRDLFGQISRSFNISLDISHCYFRFYRGGKIYGNWHLYRQGEADKTLWKLTAE